VESPVVQVIHDASQEILYTVRVKGDSFQAPTYQSGVHTVKVGRDRPGQVVIRKMHTKQNASGMVVRVRL